MPRTQASQTGPLIALCFLFSLSIAGLAHGFDRLGLFSLTPIDNEQDDARLLFDTSSSRWYRQQPQNDELQRLELQEAAHRLVARSQLIQKGGPELAVASEGDDKELDTSGSWSAPASDAADEASSRLGPASREIFLLENKDYPRSLFEDYSRRVGQVSGIATLPNDDVVIFHRSERQWDELTFNESTKRIPEDKQEQLIKNDTIMVIDGENGGSVTSFGANLFYMPHSIASDQLGNVWVSDVGRHQVMRLPVTNISEMLKTKRNGNNNKALSNSLHQVWPDIILGEAFVPGADGAHFCQPSEIVVSANGKLLYVADGYCNQRVMVFSAATGKFLKSFGEQDDLRVVHSLALIDERNLLCVADRENARILCYNAGLDGDLMRLGQLVIQVAYPLGRVFAIVSISPDHLLVSSNQLGTSRYELAILNPFTQELKLVWVSTDLLEPHSLSATRERQTAYAADISREAYKKVFKFEVIERKN